MWYLGGQPSGIATWGRGIAWQSRQTQTLLLLKAGRVDDDADVRSIVVVVDVDVESKTITDFLASSRRPDFGEI